MPGFISDDEAEAFLDFRYGGGAPATIYFALMTVAPTPSGGGTEVTGGSYARVALTNNATNFPAAATRQKRNGVAIDFGTATADWGTSMPGVALYDASSGGNFLAFAEFASAVTVLNGQPFQIVANALTITC